MFNFFFFLLGHSLGAGLSVLLGLLIRPRYPNLRVYAFATPGTWEQIIKQTFINKLLIFICLRLTLSLGYFVLAGLLSREAAKVTEEFVLTIGLGDDLVMRLSVDSMENFRTSLLITLQACKLPKVKNVFFILKCTNLNTSCSVKSNLKFFLMKENFLP